VDSVLLIAALYVAMAVRQWGAPTLADFSAHLRSFVPLFVFWIMSLYTAGLYSMDTPFTGYKAISTISIIAIFCTLLGFAFFYFRAIPSLTPKTLLVLHSFFVVGMILCWRSFFNHVALRYFPGSNVAFVNINNTVIELLHNMWKFSYTSYSARCILDPDYEEPECCGVPVFHDVVAFTARMKESGVRLIVVGREEDNAEFIQGALLQSLQNRIQLVNLTDFYETYLRRIPISDITDVWFVRNINFKVKAVYGWFKRLVDLALALVFFVVSLPFWPLIILVIRLESPGPALFKQKRLGYLGKEFTIWKFRTMRATEDHFEPTTPGDARITKLGNFLRKSRIDEIPQIINVLRGEMSFIGPRPERPELVVNLEAEVPYYRQRLLVKPGLSGWDQVSGEYHSPSVEDTYKKLQYDLYYIKNMSLFLDVSIFFKTLVTVFKRAGV
jgi:exopolysaccharide biosynthesis polyprenyl glycosylphosphotransferase